MFVLGAVAERFLTRRFFLFLSKEFFFQRVGLVWLNLNLIRKFHFELFASPFDLHSLMDVKTGFGRREDFLVRHRVIIVFVC